MILVLTKEDFNNPLHPDFWQELVEEAARLHNKSLEKTLFNKNIDRITLKVSAILDWEEES